MDQLAIDAKAATDLGMDYGDYIAKYKPPVPPAERYPKSKSDRPRCQVCGKEIPAGSKRTITCGPACAHTRSCQQNREQLKRRRQEKLQAEQSAGTQEQQGQ